MFKNFLKIAFRNITRHKGYSLLIIGGLAVGMGLFILTALYAEHEFSFDGFHKNADRIYSLIEKYPEGVYGGRHTGRIPAPILPILLSEFPEIEDGTRLVTTGKRVVRYQDKKFYENSIRYVDANFLTFFSFGMIAGNPKTALVEPLSIVLTESMAHKYFGNRNPVGQVLILDDEVNLKVTGVTKDVPSNSGLRYNFLISINSLKWQNDPKIGTATFLLLEKMADRGKLEKKFPAFIKKYWGNSSYSPERMYLFPLKDLYLKSSHIPGHWWHGSAVGIYLTLTLGILLVLVACFNYMNLSIARNMSRGRETGIRKVFGASRGRLMLHYSGESVLFSLLCFPLALMVFEIIRPVFNWFFSKGPFVYDLSVWDNPIFLVKILGVIVLVGIAAGSYPAFFLSVLKPVQALRGNLQTGRKLGLVRKILVVFQFMGSILLLIFTIAIFKQYNLIYNKDLGFNRDQVLMVPIDINKAGTSLQPMKDELLKHPGIVLVSSSPYPPVDCNPLGEVIPEGNNKNEWNTYGVNYDFIETLEMEMVRGRSFSRDYADTGNYIINQTAARQLQWKDPIGKKLTFGKNTGEVIGVVKDFHFRHIIYDIAPSLMYLEQKYFNYIFIKFSQLPVSRVIGYIEEQWNKFFPHLPFECALLTEHFDNEYFQAKWLGTIIGLVSIVTILFSCLGMLGLVAYTIRKRTKEIGIRKVYGASVPGVIRTLLWEFLRLVVTANLVAWPLAYFAVNSFIQSTYVYQPDIGISIYIFVGVITMAAALITIMYQTHKAAAANPVETLRYE